MSDTSPELLLKSALEKIVYFEARSTQLSNESHHARTEIEKLRIELAQASQREIELRRVIAELEVRATRAHSEREDIARVNDMLKRERTDLIGKMLEASRLHAVGEEVESLDLAQFIAQLREEVGALRAQRAGDNLSMDSTPMMPVNSNHASGATITEVAQGWKSEGRIGVRASDTASLANTTVFQGRTDETLFGFSVRELSAPDAPSRLRAAERLKALGHEAAAPAVAAALHAETEFTVQVALLNALSTLAKVEAVPVVAPLLTSPVPEVRVAALKALLSLDPTQAAPHLAAAMKDPNRAVRRRASLLALGLSGPEALLLGADAIRDTDADVRAVAALVLAASGAEKAKHLLFAAMRDSDERVRKAASEGISRLLGRDVTNVVGLDAAERRREVRRLGTVASNPVLMPSGPAQKVAAVLPQKHVVTTAAAGASVRVQPVHQFVAPKAFAPQKMVTTVAPAKTAVAVLEVEQAPVISEEICNSVLRELRAAIRGKTLDMLVSDTASDSQVLMHACTALIDRGQVVRRGHKYFVA